MKFRAAQKFRVTRQVLVLSAGIVWIVAGVNILRIGILAWQADVPVTLYKLGEATAVFLLFFNLVFKKLYYKHTDRIARKEQGGCPFSFFDVKGWLIMAFMITFGVTIRRFNLLPDSFISVFYTGLSTALIVTGALFLRYWYRSHRARWK